MLLRDAAISSHPLLLLLLLFTHTHARTHARTHALHTHTRSFSGTTRVSRYQKGKTNLDFTEARDSEWQWHQLGRMQVCTSLHTENHTSTPPLSFYRLDALPAAQPTASKHCCFCLMAVFPGESSICSGGEPLDQWNRFLPAAKQSVSF